MHPLSLSAAPVKEVRKWNLLVVRLTFSCSKVDEQTAIIFSWSITQESLVYRQTDQWLSSKRFERTSIKACVWYSPHLGTSQYSHLMLRSVVKHQGLSPFSPGLRQKLWGYSDETAKKVIQAVSTLTCYHQSYTTSKQKQTSIQTKGLSALHIECALNAH